MAFHHYQIHTLLVLHCRYCSCCTPTLPRRTGQFQALPLTWMELFPANSLSQRPCHYFNILICKVLFWEDSKCIGTLCSGIGSRTLPALQAGFELSETNHWVVIISSQTELTRPIIILSEFIIPYYKLYFYSNFLANRYLIPLPSIVLHFHVFQNQQFR